MARRNRCSSTACSRPSSPDSNSSLPRSTSATVSAAAMANRADTPER
ncbi:Uncharacterised protein [Mycobacterium tuberculosis]|nr:Uncharacterised protein [Mycobacterium tuberculosis]